MKDRGILAPHAPTLRAIIEAVGVDSLQEIARRPGARGVYRTTIFHHDGRARDSVSTLIDSVVVGTRLENVYRVTFGGRPIVHRIPHERYEKFSAALQSARFDELPDQPYLPPYGADLWLLERAAGTYTKSVVLAPALAEGVHAALVSALRTYLPEALREVR